MRKALLAVAVVLAIVAAPAANALFGMPHALTERGKTVEGLYNMIATMGLIMFLIVFVWLVLIIVRFREGSGHGKATHEAERHSLKAEMAWTLVPLALVLFIGYAAYGGLVTLDHGIAPKDTKMTVHVTGSQWSWAFDYGKGVVLQSNPDLAHNGTLSPANDFYLPENVPILFNITSSDQLHAFQMLDANRGYVMFVDSLPFGANQFNIQTAKLPAGDYLVQCNKMCFNPGHAYMHANVKVVPQAQFDHWMAGKLATAEAPLVQSYQVKVEGDKLTGLPAQLDMATSTRLVLDVAGTHGDLSFEIAGQHRDLAAAETVQTFMVFDLAQPGNFSLKATQGSTVLADVPAQVATPDAIVDIDMKNLFFTPLPLQFEAGKTYLIRAHNKGISSHDLNIGHYSADKDKTVLVHSDLAVPGATASVLFKPATKGAFDLWCNPHATSGMLHPGSVHVG